MCLGILSAANCFNLKVGKKMDKKIIQQCVSLLPIIRQKKPLIHHITNMVTANDNANVTLAIGASPVMALSKVEVEEMAAHADSLVLNLGILIV